MDAFIPEPIKNHSCYNVTSNLVFNCCNLKIMPGQRFGIEGHRADGEIIASSAAASICII